MGYLKGLNSLRFFAAFFVIVSHGQISLWKLGVATQPKAAFFNRGGDGVEFFFTLSGFLITGLLIREIEKTGTVSLKKFYLRRVLRIWPLYFLAVFLGFVVLGFLYPLMYGRPYFEFRLLEGLAFFLFFLPNMVTSFYPTGLLYPLWSIGVEEQYYLFWAPLIKVFHGRLLLVLAIFLVISYGLAIAVHLNVFNFSPGWVKFFLSLKFYAMAMGGLFAYVFLKAGEGIRRVLLYRGIVPLAVLFILLWHYGVGFSFSDNFWFHLLLPIGYGLLILATVIPEGIFNFEGQPWTYLGVISYGLYVYHMFVDYFLRTLFTKFGMEVLAKGFWGPLLYHTLLLGITILVASLSYRYFESYFLKLKHRYA